jgi:hypothetical protein
VGIGNVRKQFVLAMHRRKFVILRIWFIGLPTVLQWENRFQLCYICLWLWGWWGWDSSCVYNKKTDSNDGDGENKTVSDVNDEKIVPNDVTSVNDNKTVIDVNDEKTDSNDVTSAYDDGESKNELVSGVWEVKKEYDAEPRLDEAESVSVDDKSTSKKIGTQENSSVQEITKPDEILADVVKTKDTDANVTIILGHYAPFILAPAEDL